MGVTTGPALTYESALEALNGLRSNVVATQSASWSNTVYPLVAIMNAAGFEQFASTEEQMRFHMDCYGGAGGFPGHELRAPDSGWCKPVGELESLKTAVRRFLNNPSDKNREALSFVAERVKA